MAPMLRARPHPQQPPWPKPRPPPSWRARRHRHCLQGRRWWLPQHRQLRRHVIEEKFAALIEALYADTAGSVAWGGEDGPELLEIRAVAEAG